MLHTAFEREEEDQGERQSEEVGKALCSTVYTALACNTRQNKKPAEEDRPTDGKPLSFPECLQLEKEGRRRRCFKNSSRMPPPLSPPLPTPPGANAFAGAECCSFSPTSGGLQ